MLKRMKKLLSTKAARRRERGAKSPFTRLRQFERLEDRSMLSATVGPMPTSPGAYGLGMEHYGQLEILEAGMFAPPQYSASMVGSSQLAEPMHSGLHDQSAAMHGLGDGPGMWDYDGGVPLHSSLTQQTSQVQTQTQSKPTPGVTSSTNSTFYLLITSNGVFFLGTVNNPVATTAQSSPSSSTPPPSSALQSLKPPATSHVAEPPSAPNYSALNALPPSSALAAIPSSATQALSHEFTSSALVPTNAMSSTDQSYASQLLLVSTSSSGQQSSVKTVTDDRSASREESFDEFQRLDGFSIFNDRATSADAVAQEQAAVEAVLKSLKDVNSLPGEANTGTSVHDDAANVKQDARIADLVFGTLGNVALAEAEGGMVLLQASGDANASPINLSNVAADHLEMLNVRLGIEASVGFYQAVDIGMEESSAVENVPTANRAFEPLRQAKTDNRYSGESGGEVTRKAATATAVGASTLIGAMLWCVGRKKAEDEQASSMKDEHRRYCR